MKGEPLLGLIPSVGGAADSPGRLADLFDAHSDRLYRLARRLTRNADDARELVQDTFLRAAQHAKSIPNGASDEEAWLIRVLVNIRKDEWRKASVRKRFERFTLIRYSQTTEDAHQESALIARTAIWQVLDKLHPRRRAILVMHELEGLTVAKTASLLGISAITVRWHLSKGRRELSQLLNEANRGES